MLLQLKYASIAMNGEWEEDNALWEELLDG